jgi:hypothetical protein
MKYSEGHPYEWIFGPDFVLHQARQQWHMKDSERHILRANFRNRTLSFIWHSNNFLKLQALPGQGFQLNNKTLNFMG